MLQWMQNSLQNWDPLQSCWLHSIQMAYWVVLMSFHSSKFLECRREQCWNCGQRGDWCGISDSGLIAYWWLVGDCALQHWMSSFPEELMIVSSDPAYPWIIIIKLFPNNCQGYSQISPWNTYYDSTHSSSQNAIQLTILQYQILLYTDYIYLSY